MVLLHMKIYIFHILKCNICTYITLHMGRIAIAFFCILTIFFWWTVKLLLLFQKVD